MRIVVIAIAAVVAGAAPRARAEPKLDCTKLARQVVAGLDEPAVECTAARFGGPGAIVATRGRDDTGRRVLRVAAVRASGAIVAAPYELDHHVEDPEPTFELADLDGDGIDELIVRHETGRHFDGMRFMVLHVVRREFVELSGPWISFDNSGYEKDPPTICTGTLAVARIAKKARLVADITRADDPSHQCLTVGRHVFGLVAGKLVELH